jgi:hypothetical protein
LKKREDTRFMMLRYAAILLVAVITPLILYYQFNIAPDEMADSVTQIEDKAVTDNSKKITEEEDQREEREIKTKEPAPAQSGEKPVQPAAPASGVSLRESEEAEQSNEEVSINSKQSRLAESKEIEQLLKSVEAPSVPKIEADVPPEDETLARRSKSAGSSAYMSAQGTAQPDRSAQLNAKILQDSLAIRKCIDTHLSESDKVTFKIDLSIQIQKSGKIETVNVLESTHKSVKLEECLINIIKKWTLLRMERDQLITKQITY